MAYNMDRWRELLPDGWRPSWLPQMPFTDYHQLNLDWIIETVKEWSERLIAFFDEDGAKDLVEDVLEEHPEWVTTVMDGAITEPKINNSFLKEIKNPFVTPEMFGAVGDGVTDDTRAIINAFNYAKNNGMMLWSDDKTYKTTTSCIMDYGAESFPVVLNGTFDYLEFRAQPSIMHQIETHIAKVTTLKVINTMGVHFDVGYVEDFYLNGDKTIAGNGGNAYNTFTGLMYRNIHINNIGGGWCNESKFYGMRVYTIDIEGEISGYTCNNHRFYDIAMEEGVVTLHRANNNYIQARGEGNITVNDDETTWSNFVETTCQSVNLEYPKPVYTAGHTMIANQIYKYLNNQRIYTLDISNHYANGNDYDTGKIQLHYYNPIATFYVKLDTISVLSVKSDIACWTGKIQILDVNMDNVTTQADNNTSFRAVGCTYRDNNGDPYFNFAGVNLQNFDFTLNNVGNRWAKIELSTLGSWVYPEYITADLLSNTSVQYKVDKGMGGVLSSNTTPTNTDAPLGTILQNSAGTSKGWVLTTSGWQTLT